MLHRAITGVTIAVLGLSVSLPMPYAAEAGPPDRTLTVLQPILDDACVAVVAWEPLRGGKPMFAHVILKYLDPGGVYRTVLQAGADEFHKVKQNAGVLEVDLGALAVSQPAPGYRIDVNFVDGKDQAMSGIAMATSACAGAL
jgi:hypothetical protein